MDQATSREILADQFQAPSVALHRSEGQRCSGGAEGQRCSGGAKGPGADGPRMRHRLPRAKLQVPPSSLPTLSTGQLSPFPSQIASIASFVGGRPLFPAPPSVPSRFPAARAFPARLPSFPPGASRMAPASSNWTPRRRLWTPRRRLRRKADAIRRRPRQSRCPGCKSRLVT